MRSPKRKKKTDTKQLIIDTAIKLMWKDGYTEVGVDKILKEADIFKGSFYHFFPSKIDLLIACLHYLWEVQAAEMMEMKANASSPREELRAYLEWTCSAQKKGKSLYGYVPGLFHMSVSVTMIHHDPRLIEIMTKKHRDHCGYIEDLLNCMIEDGEDVCDPKATSALIIHFISGAVLAARLSNSLKPIADMTETAMHIVDSSCHLFKK